MNYRSSQVKRSRRTKANLEALQAALLEITQLERPMTVRQVFYAGVVRDLYLKTEESYDLVCRVSQFGAVGERLEGNGCVSGQGFKKSPRLLEVISHCRPRRYRRRSVHRCFAAPGALPLPFAVAARAAGDRDVA